jgi:succinylglutamic semialdehyde dehydrogenase
MSLLPNSKHYINGQFVSAQDPFGEIVRRNPAHPNKELGRYALSLANVDQAAHVAHKAFSSWKTLSQANRWQHLNQWAKEIQKVQGDLSHYLSTEIGKPLWEAQGEIRAIQEKFEITQTKAMQWVKDFSINHPNPKISGHCFFHPRGPLAVIAPFNFPLHLAMGHIIPALACGNTVLLKPSEYAPGISNMLAQTAHKAQLPPGIFNLIQGAKSVGERICKHPLIRGVLFTGSFQVGKIIEKQLFEDPKKITVLEMGGKNASVIWDDADPFRATASVLQSATITTGQRCSCTSRLFVHKNIWPAIKKQLISLAEKLKIGDPLAADTFMGPLVSQNSFEQFSFFQEKIIKLGGKNILQKKPKITGSKDGFYVSPEIHLLEDYDPQNGYGDEEIFGPDLAIYLIENLKSACEMIEKSRYGLATSLYSKERKTFETFRNEVTAGIINWNRPTTGASSLLPFGGQKASGNDFPTALFAPLYCTYPVASLSSSHDAPIDSYPGFPELRESA